MKKSIAILIAIAATALTFAGPAKPVKAPTKPMHCCVMPEDAIVVASATKNHLYQDYKGHRYYFCCGDCAASFKKNPAKYAKNDNGPIPKPAHH